MQGLPPIPQPPVGESLEAFGLRFKSPLTEQAYRLHHLGDDRKKAAMIIAFMAIGMLAYTLAGTGFVARYLLSLRAILWGTFSLASLTLAVLVIKIRATKCFDVLVFSFSIALFALQITDYQLWPADDLSPLTYNMFYILIFYVLIPNHPFLQPVPPLALTFYSIVFHLPSPHADNPLALLELIGINLIGILLAARFHKDRRIQFGLWQESLAVQKKLEELNTIVNRSPVVVFLWKHQKGRPVQFVSENVAAVFGYRVEEFITGRVHYIDLLHPADRDRALKESTIVDQTGDCEKIHHKPYRIITKQGETKWIEDHTYVRRDKDGRVTHHQGLVTDITARRRAEEALKENRNTLDNILSASPVGICLVEQGQVKWTNTALVKMFGLASAETCRGKSPDIFFADAHEYRQLNSSCDSAPSPGRFIEADVRLKRKDESTFSGNIKIRCQDPASYMTKAILIFTDISWRKKAENERINKEKLQGVVETAGAVCHEMNQPLQSISGYAQLLLMEIAEGDPYFEKISKIKNQVDRMALITQKLMNITRYETVAYLNSKIIDIDKAAE